MIPIILPVILVAGLTWWITRPIDAPIVGPELAVPAQPMGSRSPAVEQLLSINEQAASLAGYPAIVESDKRATVARQSARQITALFDLLTHIQQDDASQYIQRQVVILKQMQVALDAYANGEGAAALLAASSANAVLRAEMESLPGTSPGVINSGG